MQWVPGKKIYFLSDFHLGAPNEEQSLLREKRIVRFLQNAKKDAAAIFIVGDIFDFWFEYATVVPKGFVRLLGCLADLSDAHIELHIFTGNHDLWMNDYLVQEIGLTIYRDPILIEINSTRVLVGHGDGLGPGDYKYKVLKFFFKDADRKSTRLNSSHT